jgi:hypothetical protein
LALQAADAPAAMPPLPPSPVQEFRAWLGLNESALAKELASYPEQKRIVLRSKIKEYSALPAEERERRLKMVELRHYLLPLMQMAPAEREQRAKAVPDNIKEVLKERLKQWDALDSATQKTVLDSEWASRYFVRLQGNKPMEMASATAGLSQAQRAEIDAKLAHWKLLPPPERLRRYRQFNAFFELPAEKKEKALGMLNEKERAEMENTLKMFDRLNPAQRASCIESFRRFANMSPQERTSFLQSAERWKNLPAEDREAWRKLVQSIPPLPSEMPPMPVISSAPSAISSTN